MATEASMGGEAVTIGKTEKGDFQGMVVRPLRDAGGGRRSSASVVVDRCTNSGIGELLEEWRQTFGGSGKMFSDSEKKAFGRMTEGNC